MAANEAMARGWDPFAPNPLDPEGRPFLYSTWWLWRGLNRADTDWLGYLLVAATLVAALLIWRVRSWREALVGGRMLLSPAWLLAIYRANSDLVIFVLLVVTVRALQHSSRLGRALGALLVGTMAVLKYFPAAAIIGLLRAPRRREVLALLAMAAGMVLLGWSSLEPALAAITRYGAFVTNSVGLQAFGRSVLAGSLSPFAPPAVAGLLGLTAMAAGYQLARAQTGFGAGSAESEQRFMTSAVFGAVLLACFLIGTSYLYKLVFLWALLPWLMRDAADELGRRRTLWLLALLLAAAWIDGLAVMGINRFAPGWSPAGRSYALGLAHCLMIVSQLGYWLIMGACLRLSVDWSRRQFPRLTIAP